MVAADITLSNTAAPSVMVSFPKRLKTATS